MNKITNDLYYVGVNDHIVDLFEGQYDVPNGMAYNSYIIMDEKITVMDTVDQNFKEEWLNNVSEVLTLKVEEILLLPGSKILIPSGIHVNLPKNVFLNAENKSGIASKRGLLRGACVTGDTLIETNKGKFKASDLTKEFCENNNILIKSWDGLSKTYVYKKCDGFRITNEIECVKIIFNDETYIREKQVRDLFLKEESDI